MTALAYTGVILALASVTAIALSFRAGHDQPVRYAVLRVRWAWRCRGNPPLPDHETVPEPERS